MRGGKALVATVAVFRDERKRRRNEVWISFACVFLVIADIPLFRVRDRFFVLLLLLLLLLLRWGIIPQSRGVKGILGLIFIASCLLRRSSESIFYLLLPLIPSLFTEPDPSLWVLSDPYAVQVCKANVSQVSRPIMRTQKKVITLTSPP